MAFNRGMQKETHKSMGCKLDGVSDGFNRMALMGLKLPKRACGLISALLKVNPSCPFLPTVSEVHDYTLTRRHAGDKGAEFYCDALRYAQSQWICGKPAQAILQLDKAWMADLPADDPVLVAFPPPYEALVWILAKAASGGCGYVGNPVRHFQHLASRMSGPRASIRSARAWVCLHLAEKTVPATHRSRDGWQLAREGLWIPGFGYVLNQVSRGGWRGEASIAAGSIR